MYLLKSLVALAAVLFTVALAAPTVQFSQQVGNNATANGSECGPSSFEPLTDDKSPKADDCLVIVKNIANGGRWEIEAVTGKQHQLVQWGTCAFGVKPYQFGNPYFYVGNEDIIDIIHTSIQKFGYDGLVAAKGRMFCNPKLNSPGADWQIYHTKSEALEARNDNDNECGPSTFQGLTDGNSPTIDDCLVILKNIAGGGRWTVEDQRQLVQWGTCAFAVSAEQLDSGYFFVGNQDIIDIIQDSIQQFGSDGRVAAKGTMFCNPNNSPGADWEIYHTKSKALEVRDDPDDTIPDFTPPTADTLPEVLHSNHNRWCGESSYFFVNQTSIYSPEIKDCRQIAEMMYLTQGFWNLTNIPGPQHKIAAIGTCAFAIRAWNYSDPTRMFHVGTKDVSDLIFDSIAKFSDLGLVGSKGTMQCDYGNGATISIDWGVYHNHLTHNASRGLEAREHTTQGISDSTDDKHSTTFAPRAAAEGNCGVATFIGETSGTSPKIEDCLVVVKNIANDGRWNVECVFGDRHRLASWGTCSFYVQGKSSTAGSFYVGNQDIIDLLTSSIQKFGSGGLVGASGHMPCNGQLSTPVNVGWHIVHTNTEQSEGEVPQISAGTGKVESRSVLPRQISGAAVSSSTAVAELPAPTNATALSLEAAPLVNETHPFVLVAEVSNHKCQPPTFRGETKNDSPRIEDCLTIAKNIASGGKWTVEAVICHWHQLVQFGTCALQVKARCPWNSRHDSFFYIGNDDMIDAIKTSIDMFGDHGQVGAYGSFTKCTSWLMPPPIDFEIIRNPGVPLAVRDSISSLPSAPAALVDETHPVVFTVNTDAGAQDRWCGTPSFTGETNDDSPLIADCLTIVKNIGSGGSWTVESFICGYHTLVHFGSCALGVHAYCPSGSLHDLKFQVGNEDIIDVIKKSVDAYGSNGRVGAHGSLGECQALLMPPTVDWNLYNTKKHSVVKFLKEKRTSYPSLSPYYANDTAAGLAGDSNPMSAASADGNNECGDSTFHDNLGPNSPLIDDCLVIARNIGAGGKWEIESTAKNQHQIVQYGTCAMGVQGTGGLAFYFYIGNQDIIDLINVSIQMYGRDGRVQTSGEMLCSAGHQAPPSVGWGIYTNTK